MSEYNGGPAFPATIEGPMDSAVIMPGMTLRDYFAAKAMQGMLARPGGVDPKQDAEFAYIMADAMLEARKGKS